MAHNQNQQPQAGAQRQNVSQSFQQMFDQLPEAGPQGHDPNQPFPPLDWNDLDNLDTSNFDPDFFLNFAEFDEPNATFTNGNINANQSFQDASTAHANFVNGTANFTNINTNANDNGSFQNFSNGHANVNPNEFLDFENGFTNAHANTINSASNPTLGRSYFSMVNQFGSYPLDPMFTNATLHNVAVNPNMNVMQPDALLEPANADATNNDWHGHVEEVESEHAASPIANAATPTEHTASPTDTAGSIVNEEQTEDGLEDHAAEHDSLFGDDEDTLIDGAPSPESNGDVDADTEIYEEDDTAEFDEEEDDRERVDYGEVNIADLHDPKHVDIVYVDDFDNPDYDSYGTITPPDGSIDESQDESEVEEEEEEEEEQEQEDTAPPKKKKARKSKKDDPVYDDITHHLPALMNSPNLTNDEKERIMQCIPEKLVLEMYKYKQMPAKQDEVDEEMTEYNYRPAVDYERLTKPVSTAYPKYTGHFKTYEQARAWRKREREPAKNQATDLERVSRYGRAFWVREIYNAMIDTPLMLDTPSSIHRTRFSNPVFDPIDLESVAHDLFDSCIKVHQRGFSRVDVYHKIAIRGKLVDYATQSVELRLVKLISCLRKCKAAVDDAIRGGISMALLCDNPAAREFTKQSNNAGNKKRGERLRTVKENEKKEGKKVRERKPKGEEKAKVVKKRGGKKAAAPANAPTPAQQSGQGQ